MSNTRELGRTFSNNPTGKYSAACACKMAYKSGPNPNDWKTTAFPQSTLNYNIETMIEVMLFCTDYPALTWYRTKFYSPANVPIPQQPSHIENIEWWGAGMFSYYDNILFVPDTPQLNPRQVAIGKTYTHGAHVRGYPCGAIVPYYGYKNAQQALLNTYIHWFFAANTTVQYAPPPFDFWNGWTVPAPLDVQPVLVREQDYTAEIAETNMLSFEAWGMQYRWPVVGIFATCITDWTKKGALKVEGEGEEKEVTLDRSLADRMARLHGRKS